MVLADIAYNIAAPQMDASTVAGQFEWFVSGFCYSAFIQTVALGVWLFRQAGKGGFGE